MIPPTPARPDAPGAPPTGLRCRLIEAADLPAVAALLARGFPGRPLPRWERGLAAMAGRAVPPGRPRFGYALEAGGRPVGAILMIHGASPRDGDGIVRCNLSSWYVEPAFRAYAALMVHRATGSRDVVYFNISPAPWTLPILAAQGFARYSADRFFSVPALAFGPRRARIEAVRDAVPDGVGPADAEALLAARRLGCLSVVARAGGEALPFAFLRTVVKGVVPAALVVHAPSAAALARVAGPLGRFLALRGMPLVLIDGDGPAAGLPGLRRSGGLPKYCKGPLVPRPWDLVDCEWTVFGS